MACFRPLEAYRDRVSGEVALGARLSGVGDKLELPCGRCVGCKLDRARAWSIRIGHEASLYAGNVFATLDYRPDALRSLSLEYGDFQRFMKRLRKRLEGVSSLPDGRRPIRFFVAGEYGERFGRPHWHAILFNTWFPDSVRFANGTWRSELAEELWSHGNVVLGEVTPASAAYVAGYTLGKAYKRAKDYEEDLVNPLTGEVSGRRPEFVRMSRNKGIGSVWYDRWSSDLWNGDQAVQDGRAYKVPRFYYERLRRENPLQGEEVAHGRFLRALETPREESTPERRAVREEYTQARYDWYEQREH